MNDVFLVRVRFPASYIDVFIDAYSYAYSYASSYAYSYAYVAASSKSPHCGACSQAP